MPQSKTSSRANGKHTNPSGSNSRRSVRQLAAPSFHRNATKQDQVLTLLRAKRGTTIPALAKATGWQPHSVRGFLAGVVKKKLGLSLSSEKTESGRVYRIAGKKPASDRVKAKGEPSHA